MTLTFRPLAGHGLRAAHMWRPARVAAPILASAFLCLNAGMTAAQDRLCAPRDTVLDRLATRYGETRRAIGLGADNGVMEVFASDASGTWTITVTRTTGLTCLVASGESFETLADALPTQEEET